MAVRWTCLAGMVLAATMALVAAPDRAGAAAPAGGGGAATAASPGHYKSFKVAVYIVVNAANINTLPAEWERLTAGVKVDKVYLETYRSRRQMPEANIEPLKKFFNDRGVEVAGGLTLVYNDSGQFVTFSYARPEEAAQVKAAVEIAARHFDEIILDDFFFYATKTDEDIAAKGDRSWTDFRIETMRRMTQELVLGPAKAINPRVKMVIKYPNWYEHFAASGFDLDQQAKAFDGIHTGTETRDPLLTEQHLQPYQSYQIMRYFENIKPGGNGGGWVDTYQYTYADRYVEQLWGTVWGKAREMTLFNYSDLLRPMAAGPRPWGAGTSFDFDEMVRTTAPAAMAAAGGRGFGGGAGPGGGPSVTAARVAGFALEQADKVVQKLGTPIGIKSYRPPHALGEDFLHNFLGMIGLPIDLYPTYPADANTILLTEAAKFDPDIIAKIRQSLVAGKNVVVTSGFAKAMLGKGLEHICELSCTGNRIQVTSFHRQGGAAIAESEMARPITFPEITFRTNDAWYVLAGVANGNGFPILISNRYSAGTFYVWAIPDNFTDLYSMPPSALALIREVLTRDLRVRLDGPAQVALFAYDNGTCIVHNYTGEEKTVTLAVAGTGAAGPGGRGVPGGGGRGGAGATGLRDLLTDQVIGPAQARGGPGRGFGGAGGFGRGGGMVRTNFTLTLKPHSYQALAAD